MSFFVSIVNWMQESWLGEAGREIYWVFPAAEIVHFFGLCLFIGAILIVDLRVLGFAKRLPLQAVLSLIPISLLGLVLNILSGIVFLCTYPENYWPSFAFRLKLGIIVLGCINALWFKWMETPRISQFSPQGDVDFRMKSVAALSIGFWTVAIIIGRFLPFVSVSTS
jgi:hypothetical protein